jgi:hypothetical protein
MKNPRTNASPARHAIAGRLDGYEMYRVHDFGIMVAIDIKVPRGNQWQKI